MALKNVIPFITLCSVWFFLNGCEHKTSFNDVPEWAKNAVWYQIFPERFRNGDDSNDPQLADIQGAWPRDMKSPYQISTWTQDWYRLEPWEQDDKDFYYHVQRRRYGGDLQGVIDKLDYLEDLGITAIYFNPLFESPSLHKYDSATFHHIDNNFGPDPVRDKRMIAGETPDDPDTWKWTSADSLFLALIRRAHERHIRIIIDGVFNHVGLEFWAFKDVRKKQLESKYVSWFAIKSWDNPHTPEDEFDYAGWVGVKDLPEFSENDNGFVPAVRDYIFSSVKRWMDPNGDGDPEDGIDGWRLDTAEWVKLPFWRDFRKFVRTVNPDAYTVGEVWWQDWSHNKMFNAEPWLKGDVFDAVMNYRWARETIHFFVDDENKISASEFDSRLNHIRNDYRPQANYVLMNLLDSHDTDRIGSQIINKDDDYDHRDNPRENPEYSVRKPTKDEIQIQKLIAIFQMTYLGAPTIYYGDEAGMWGADDPDCRKPMLWRDMKYEDERTHPFGKPRPVDENSFNENLFAHYKKLIHLRKQHPALQTGKFASILTDDKQDVYAFERFGSRERLIVLLNNSIRQQTVHLSLKQIHFKKDLQDLLTGESFQVEKGSLALEMAAKSGMILF